MHDPAGRGGRGVLHPRRSKAGSVYVYKYIYLSGNLMLMHDVICFCKHAHVKLSIKHQFAIFFFLSENGKDFWLHFFIWNKKIKNQICSATRIHCLYSLILPCLWCRCSVWARTTSWRTCVASLSSPSVLTRKPRCSSVSPFRAFFSVLKNL